MRNAYFVTILIALFTNSICCAAVRYITVSGNGLLNGTSWLNAFPDDSLQYAINISSPGDEVWVACGTYFTTTSTNRAISFSMRNGVAVYGNFQGFETAVSQRVFNCGSCSILSAEIGVAGNFDNSYHVISNTNLNNTAVLDGFTISGANDNRAATETAGLGGGIYNQGSGAGNNSSPTIRNCIISNNRAVFGAGIFNSGYNGGISNPIISHCIITNNTATNGGGGIDNFGLLGTASPIITNCIIYANTALTAGGMYCWGGNPGGNSSPVILNCIFANNSATAGNAGGIIADNSDAFGGTNSGTSNPVVRNSIFWNNTATGAGPQFAIKGTGTFTATYSDINITGQSSPHIISGAGTGNIFSNPLFLNIADGNGADNCWMTADDGLTLQSLSAAINAGSNTGVPALDLLFSARIRNGIVDMGAYEFQSISLNLKMFLQGYYTGLGVMQPVLNNQAVPFSSPSQTDTITVELHHPTTYTLIDTRKAVLQTNGTVLANFTQPDGQYYIAIRHRNALQTWNALPLACGASTPLYDFSTGAGQAFGNNQVQVEPAVWAFFTGDINQDEYIDGNDFPQYDFESASGGLYDGSYTITDMNGDGFVDGNDFPVFDSNSSNGVSSIHP